MMISALSSSSRLTALESDRCSNSMHTRRHSKFDWFESVVCCAKARVWLDFYWEREKRENLKRALWENRERIVYCRFMLADSMLLPFASTCCLLLVQPRREVVDILLARWSQNWISLLHKLENFKLILNISSHPRVVFAASRVIITNIIRLRKNS